MAENNKIENTKKLEDADLSKVSGGTNPDEVNGTSYSIAKALKDIGEAFDNLGNALQQIKTAIDTNTCPICNTIIVPGAEKCELMDLIQHVKAVHNVE